VSFYIQILNYFLGHIKQKKFTFANLPVTRTPYAIPILPFRYLVADIIKNEKFLKNGVRYLADIIMVGCFWVYPLPK
jgi:hypothetical protein